MNPLVQALVGAAVRWLVTFAAAHEVTVSDDTATQVVSGAVALGMLLWSFVHKKKVDTRIKEAGI